MRHGLARSLVTLLLIAAAPASAAADRVIALSPHLAELVCAAGACGKLVGTAAYSDYPPQVLTVPQVGDAFAVNIEQVVGLAPDLVLAWDGGTPRETIERLRGLKLNVEAIAIRTLDDVPRALRELGTRLETRPAAERAARDYEKRLVALRAKHAKAAPVRVLYQIEANPPYSVNRDSPISQVIELCGGRNLFADLPAIAAPVEREAILARDPQAILYTRQDDVAGILDYWKRSPPVTATRARTFYELNGDFLDRATPRLLDGAEQVCAALTDARAKLRATAPPSRRAPAPGSAPRRTGSPTGG